MRRVFWIYRSADDGWCVFIFGRGYHITRVSDHDARILIEHN